MTEKLYYSDSHMSEFSAEVLSVTEENGKFAVTLDRTAFFPEGGGQGSDTGFIGGVRVYDVQIKNGVIYHYTEKPLEEGKQVACAVDFDRRFRNMQNHSGEHIISGIVHRLYGYENVGFHLRDEMTVDFDGELTRKQLDEIEDLANKAVYENLPVRAYFPKKDELDSLSYRSKKEINEDLRIVEIEGVDVCACCAPHVRLTGEIGVIKILDFFKNKGGVRLFVKCGRDALADYRDKYKNTLEISNLLSVKQHEASAAVNALNAHNAELKAEISRLKKRLIEEKALNFNSTADRSAVFEDGLDIKELQLYADALYKRNGGIRAVFSENGNGYAFAICGEESSLDGFFGEFKAALPVRGGGRNGIVQGTVNAKRAEIEKLF